jgi:hypothetical protein
MRQADRRPDRASDEDGAVQRFDFLAYLLAMALTESRRLSRGKG